MIRRPVPFLLARATVGVFVILSAAYCLLAYIPFTYHQVNLGGLLPWFSIFAKYHPYLYWPAFIAALLSLPGKRDGRVRLLSVLFAVVYGALGVYLLTHPLLSRLENDIASVVFAMVAFVPLAWMGWLDWLAEGHKIVWAKAEASDTGRLFRACLLTPTYMALLLSALFVVRQGTALSALRHWHVVIICSLGCHVIVFMGLFLLLTFTEAIATVLHRYVTTSAVYAGGIVALFAVVLRLVVFRPLSFVGLPAAIIALVAAVSIWAFVVGGATRMYHGNEELQSPLELYFAPLRRLRTVSLGWRALILVSASVGFSYLLWKAANFDWEYLVQTSLLLAMWAGVFAFFYVTVPPSIKRGSNAYALIAGMVVASYLAVLTVQSRAQSTPIRLTPQLATAADEYADFDVGFRFARNVISPRVNVASDDSLFRFLAANTNIPRSTRTEPVEVNLVGHLVPSTGPKPHIFIFVIDSLRRDYLSPYNPAVNFTPAIAAFAHENVVVPNSFTRYSGTGLSEPSIWSGSMLLHKQYVTPFYPMNALQKLVDVEGYRQFVTKDEILSAILAPSKAITPLDENRPTMNCNLCQTLRELQGKVAASISDPAPIFVYTQPQDLHVSVINRDGRAVPDGETYAGFDAPYAARVRRLDTCFGEFVAFLKRSGLYENSVIILTADHGDSLGEHGRWGHAYNVVPEVVRVPLIIHLPSGSRSLVFEERIPAFLVDITPTLYYLLGHRPIARNQLFGRPLFTSSSDEVGPYTYTSYLIASSYGPVYGLLEGDGRSLYVVDGVSYKDYQYDWQEGTGLVSTTVSPETRAQRQQLIRTHVDDIAHFYGFFGASH